MKATLYSISVSHPARAAGLMLRHKQIEHEIVDIMPGMQPLQLRLNGFRGPTVPALKIDGRKVQGSLNISRALEDLRPEPHLFPTDPQQRAAVEEAERWGEAELQPPPRNMFRWALSRDQDLRQALGETIGVPMAAAAGRLMMPVSWYFARVVSGVTEDSIRADLTALPAKIDHVDELIEEGVIGGEEPNAADFQIGTSVRVLLNFPQLQPLIEGRPAGEHAMQLVPKFGRTLPIELPDAWVPAPAFSS